MATAKSMTELYERNRDVTGKYVHATSRGHEAIQLACAMQLKPQDWVSPYYRDDSILLGIGMRPYHCMLQRLAKRDDPFSGGRTYYCHPSLNDADKPKIPHQSSATGMQAIPATGVAMGIALKEIHKLGDDYGDQKPVVICSIGDAAMTEGEVAEAMQMAALKQLPIIYLVDSAGVYLPMQDEIFADKEHFGRMFRNNAHMSAMGITQIAAVMGSCVAGGAYLPIMSDEAMIVDKTGSIFLAGSYLVKAAIGENIDNETLGGATTHCEISGVTDYKCKDDADVEKVGTEWLLAQSKELKAAGVPVLHYYTLGKPHVVCNVVREL